MLTAKKNVRVPLAKSPPCATPSSPFPSSGASVVMFDGIRTGGLVQTWGPAAAAESSSVLSCVGRRTSSGVTQIESSLHTLALFIVVGALDSTWMATAPAEGMRILLERHTRPPMK